MEFGPLGRSLGCSVYVTFYLDTNLRGRWVRTFRRRRTKILVSLSKAFENQGGLSRDFCASIRKNILMRR